jgi:cyclopropane-fatty-acyl-phospholipid synthase
MKSEAEEITRASAKDTVAAMHILRAVFRAYPGNLAVRLWTGETAHFGTGAPEFTLAFHHPSTVRDIVLSRNPLRLAEAYFNGQVDVEGDLYVALALKDHLPGERLPVRARLGLAARAMKLDRHRLDARAPVEAPARRRPLLARIVRRHSKRENERAISFHYDVSNDFYRLWLDERMVYSCAYFEDSNDTIEQAQRNKLDHICRKLRLKPGERFLDIGCGWGALLLWAAKHYGVHAHGVTLSREQYAYASARILEEGLQDRVRIELRDYRDLDEADAYDKIASVGMFEHVGLKHLTGYFTTVHRALRPGGLFLNHGITHDEEGWRKTTSTDFINRYVFPDGELDTVGNVQRVMERANFEILDVEALRRHYAMTLRHWVSRLERNRTEALRHAGEATYRVWHLYMAACAMEFERGDIGVYQILAAKRRDGFADVPLTRGDLYRRDAAGRRFD